MLEEWRDISGYEGVYRVSDRGKVKRLGRRGQLSGKRNKGKYINAKLLRQTKQDNGYFYVGLWQDSKRKTFTVSRLVAIAFLPNPEGFKYVRHKDGNKKNNWLYNLEWCKTANMLIKQAAKFKKRKILTAEERSKLPGFTWPMQYYSRDACENRPQTN